MGEKVSNPPSPGSDEHTKMITASKIPAILGIDPYRTTGELWLQMSGLAVQEDIDDTTQDMFDWGHCSETSLSLFWQGKNPEWSINQRRGEVAFTTDLPFPNLATIDRIAYRRKGKADDRQHRLEIKTSASRKKWGERGDELPQDVLAQTTFQAGLSGIHRGSVVALVSADIPQIPRIYNAGFNKQVFEGIVDVCRGFYKSLGEHEPELPPSDLLDELASMSQNTGEGEVEAPDDLVDEYHKCKIRVDEAKDDLDQAKNALLNALGDGKKLVHDGRTVVSRSPGRFSKTALSKIEEAAHLLKHKNLHSLQFDPKKLKADYPDVYAAACGQPVTKFQ